MTTAADNNAQGRDPLTFEIIGCAMTVHRKLGPGLLESVYEECLHREMSSAGFEIQRQPSLKVAYGESLFYRNYRPDFIVNNEVVVEIKSVAQLHPVHQAQLLTYLKLSGLERGLVINFNTSHLYRGVKRLILSRPPA